MKTHLKKKSIKYQRTIVIVLFTIATLVSALIWQKQLYDKRKLEVNNIFLVPGAYIKTGTRYIEIYINEERESFHSIDEFRSLYNLSISPELNLNLKMIEKDAVLNEAFTTEYLERYKNEHPDFARAIKEIPESEFFKFKKEESQIKPTLAIVREGQFFKEDTQVTFTITSKSHNIWNYVIGQPKKVVSAQVTIDTQHPNEDDIDRILDRHITSVSNYYFNEKNFITQNQQQDTCPVKYKIREGTFNDGDIEWSTSKNEDFMAVKLDCSLDDALIFDGEQITVEIYTPNIEDGKRAFREALAKDGFKESDKLRVVYIHAPK